MKLKKERIEFLSKNIVNTLIDDGDIIYLEKSRESLYNTVSSSIIEELIIEDRINDEVKEIMKAHYNKIDAVNADYSRMFKMIKNKLIKDRGLII